MKLEHSPNAAVSCMRTFGRSLAWAVVLYLTVVATTILID